MSQNNTVTAANYYESADSSSRFECTICSNIVEAETTTEAAPWDERLLETREFVCTPSVGALTEGYVLTIPKRHSICSGALGRDALHEYWDFTKLVADHVGNEYGSTIIFEHGPSKPDTLVGCGVDHAHMHVVPFEGSVTEQASRINPEPITWRRLTSIDDLADLHEADNEYLFLKNGDDTPVVGTAPTIASQLFRRVIAGQRGIQQKFDWKSHPFEANVRKTKRRLGSKFPSNYELTRDR